ncbi:serine-type endopeptidase activity protein [Homalodisca vitripennis]|nr:serine-type endopeptidase activity protein [Homalodisca vitripennis]
MDPRLCTISTSGDFRPNPAWDSFCQSRLHKGSSAGQRAKTRCCHPANAQAGYFSQQLFDWRFPQLPWFLRYAPGVRSNFMCEVYNRYVCKGTENTCFLNHGINRASGRPGHIKAATIREFPHIARLGVMARNVLLFHCLGSLISRRFILSAWTCRDAHGITTNIVLLGDDDTEAANSNTEQIYMIGEIRNPALENFDPPGDPPFLYEPTLYKTTRDVVFNEFVRPACIYYDPINRPTEGTVAYFGKTKGDAPEGRYLRKSVLPIHGDLHDPESYYKQCRAKQFYNARHLNKEYFHHGASLIHQFCAGDPADQTTGPCKYDRGAPIQRLMNTPYCSWNILGVLSSTRWNCSNYTPFVFHNISYFVRLIEDIVWPIPFMNPEIALLNCGFSRPSYWTPTWN